MYKDYFSLTNNVFGNYPDGSEVFMGSQQAKIRARLTHALSSADTVVTVTGPVGSGKTTLVEAALKDIPGKQVVARIARIKLRHDEVLELLVCELGMHQQPASTIQRFVEVKQRLNEWQEQGTRVFIIVEDAQRIGSDAIAELETLTSADAGGANGASIVLMGLAKLNDQLNADVLTRTKQRTSLQLALQPFSAAEVQEYLAHRFAAAGGKVAELLESGAADMIYRCTGGSPRVINKLCEAVLQAAAEEKTKTISASLVERIAHKEFAIEPAAENAAHGGSPATTASLPDEPAQEPIPHLIQDTLTGVEALPGQAGEDPAASLSIETVAQAAAPQSSHRILTPQVPEALTKTHVDPAEVKELDDALRPDTNLLQVLEVLPPRIEDIEPVPLGLQDQMPQPSSPQPEVPDGAPVSAQSATGDTQTLRKPNLQALESAMATARKGPIELNLEAETPAAAAEEATTAASAVDRATTTDVQNLPRITLDHCLQERQQEAEALLEEKNPTSNVDDDEEAKQRAEADRAKLDKLATDLGGARSLEDIDDVAAETLFGEEFSQMAAAVATMAAEDSADDPDVQPELELDDTPSEAAHEWVDLKTDQAAATKAEEPAVSLASITPDDTAAAPDINASANRRFAMLKAMNESTAKAPHAMEQKSVAAEPKTASTEASELPEKQGSQLTPIENQFGSAMTKTLKALIFDRRPEEDEEKSGGFLSHFKRS